MSKILGIVACGVVIASTKTADAVPVLLATVSNDAHPYVNDIIETAAMGDVFQYSVQNEDGYFRVRLYEDTRVSVLVNDAPITLNESVTAVDDPDFALVAQFLTDGVSFAENVFQDVMVLRMFGDENVLDVHVPRISEYDLFGYTIERIDRHLTFSSQSPGRDLNGDGVWTDFHIGGVYEF